MMFRYFAIVTCWASSMLAFQPNAHFNAPRESIKLNALTNEEKAEILKEIDVTDKILKRVEKILDFKTPREFPPYDGDIQQFFPGCITNGYLEDQFLDILAEYGFTAENTLLATSLCCDELARRLEDDLVKIFGLNFNLGGLAGFCFAGNTGFGAMSAHIPDDGSCLIVYGPHVGITKDGVVGKVERSGIELVDSCCGSAIAASNYVKGITDGGAEITMKIKQFTDFQQGAVKELILPHGKRLSDAKNRMVELPLALFESQDLLMTDIVKKGASGGKKNGYALLGGIQINTAPDTSDYFLPLRFDLVNTKGEVTESLLDKLDLDER